MIGGLRRSASALAAILGALAGGSLFSAEVSKAMRDDQGVIVHQVQSEYQAGTTQLKVILPKELDPSRRYPVLYLLPVEEGTGSRWGDPVSEALRLDLANHYGLILVEPTFSHLPWYADHPTDPTLRQESYLLKVVLPAIEKNYPAQTTRDGRLLVGFSKSGWGAFSLLLRHPDVFGRAAAWDAPLNKDAPDQFGMGPIFGTPENFAQYRIFSLFEARAGQLRDEPRLVLTGYGSFRSHHEAAHAKMDSLRIAHVYRDGPARKHAWDSGWLVEAVELLVRGEKPAPGVP